VSDRDIFEAFPVIEPRADDEHYREMARGLRQLAQLCRFEDPRNKFLRLAADYDRRADHLAGPLASDRDVFEAVPTVEPPAGGKHYREMARGLRQLARPCRFAGDRKELLRLAANYDRRADHFDSRA
jgi:hypothetical protein